jgi:sRNA-binding carbon storage regulator CsrA
MLREDDIRNLVTHDSRRLQKLKEKQAKFGINTPPEILIEIEDIEAKISEAEADLKSLEVSLPVS